MRRLLLHLGLGLPLATILSRPVHAQAGAAAAAPEPHPLVDVLPGALPLILSVPHDGTEPVPDVPERRQGERVRDLHTRPLAEAAAARLAQRLGQRPVLVAARFGRRWIDANRAEAEALESPAALPAYRAYHGALAAHVARLAAAGPALLIDVHGQAAVPGAVLRGTRNGQTVRALRQRAGDEALHGPDSLAVRLQAHGLPVQPTPGDASAGEDPRYLGGHIVAQYGSHRAGGIDAIQLEFGRALRERADTGTVLGDALAEVLLRWGYWR